MLEPHVDRVIVVSPDDTGITQARAKTDRLDARALAMLLVAYLGVDPKVKQSGEAPARSGRISKR